MVLFIGYHSSPRRYRRSIRRRGLVVHAPKRGGRCGVYAFHPDVRNNNAPIAWGDWVMVIAPTSELWRIAYCGPMHVDPLVQNAVILPSVTDVTLVTGNE